MPQNSFFSMVITPKLSADKTTESIYIPDSSGFNRYFTRNAGSKGLFFNQFAGLPRHPRSGYGPGEYADMGGNLFSREKVEESRRLLAESNTD